jgi:hypothetical protein
MRHEAVTIPPQKLKQGHWVLRVGRTIRIPCAEVLALLGIDTDQMRGSQS